MKCLDTSAIIDFLNGKKEAIHIVGSYIDSITTTEINVFETFLGIYLKKTISEREENQAREFFKSIEVLPMKKGSGKLASKILADLTKQGKTIGQNDCFTASIMLSNNINEIITSNKKHFSKVKGIKVIGY